MIDREEAIGLWRVLSEVRRVRHHRRQYVVALLVFNHLLSNSFVSEALQKGVLEGLEERNGPGINHNLIDVVNVDWAPDVQAPSLGQEDIVVATFPIVVVGILSGVAPRVHEDEGVPLIVPLSGALTWVKVREHREHDVSTATPVGSPSPESRTKDGVHVLPVRAMAHRRQLVSVRGRQRTHDVGKRQPSNRVTIRYSHSIQARRKPRIGVQRLIESQLKPLLSVGAEIVVPSDGYQLIRGVSPPAHQMGHGAPTKAVDGNLIAPARVAGAVPQVKRQPY